MPRSNPYLVDLPDDFFLKGLEGKPKTQKEYAIALGVNVKSLEYHMSNLRPAIWGRIRREIKENREEARGVKVAEKLESKADSSTMTAKEREVKREINDISTLQGRKIRALEERNHDLHEQIRHLQDRVFSQREFHDQIVAASTEPLPKPSYKVRRGEGGAKKEERAVLLPIFDMQVGAKVVPDDTVGGIGEFNSTILAKRAKHYVEVVAKIIHAQAINFRIGPLVFALGGDMVEGDEIFDEQAWQLEMPTPDQVILARDTLTWIIDGIMEAAAEAGAKEASILAVPGNHGRRGKKKGGRHKSDSFDVLVYRLLEERFRNYPLRTFAIEPAGNVSFDVMGSIFSMIHGDEVRSWGSLPFYGMTRHDAKMIRTVNVIPDYVLLGHHHQPANIPIGYGEWIMSGNWVGATNLSNIVGSNTPQQSLFMVSEDKGLLTREPIMLDEVRRPEVTIHQTR